MKLIHAAMTEDKSNGLDRRKFMKRAAATSAISFGVLGTSTSSAAAAVPASPGRAESLLDTHADGVLSMLEADGVLADRSDLPTAVDNDVHGIVRGSEGTAMLRAPERAEELKVVKSVDDGMLTVTVQPDSNRAFAILDTGDGRIGYSLEKGQFDFDTQNHDCSCMNISCEPGSCGEECCDYDGNCHYSCDCAC